MSKEQDSMLFCLMLVKIKWERLNLINVNSITKLLWSESWTFSSWQWQWLHSYQLLVVYIQAQRLMAGRQYAIRLRLIRWRSAGSSSEELGGFVNAEQAGSKRPIVCCPCRFGVCWNPTCIWMSWGESSQPTCPTVSGGDFIDGIAVIPSWLINVKLLAVGEWARGFVNAEQAGSKRLIVCCPCRFGVCWMLRRHSSIGNM